MPLWVRGWGCEGEFKIPALEGRPGAGAWLPGPTPRDCGSVSLPRSVVGIPTREALVQLQPRQRYTIYVRALSVGGPSARSDPVTVYTTGMFPGPHAPRDLREPLCGRPALHDFSGKWAKSGRGGAQGRSGPCGPILQTGGLKAQAR